MFLLNRLSISWVTTKDDYARIRLAHDYWYRNKNVINTILHLIEYIDTIAMQSNTIQYNTTQ